MARLTVSYSVMAERIKGGARPSITESKSKVQDLACAKHATIIPIVA